MKLKVNSMNCGHCEKKVTAILKENGVKEVLVDLSKKEVVASNEIEATKACELLNEHSYDAEVIEK